MEKIKTRKRSRLAKAKDAIRDNFQMVRFIREIEREEFLDIDSLKTLYALNY